MSSSSSSREFRQTYHPQGHGVSEGLARARRPFRTGNAITGALITSFALSVYFYSIRAVAQDDFSDILPPSETERARTISLEDEMKSKLDAKRNLTEWNSATGSNSAAAASTSPLDSLSSVGGANGALLTADDSIQNTVGTEIGAARIGKIFPGRGYDSSLFYGAPDVDKLGRLRDSNWGESSRVV